MSKKPNAKSRGVKKAAGVNTEKADIQFLKKLSAGKVLDTLGKKISDFTANPGDAVELMRVGCIVKGVDFYSGDKGDSLTFHGQFTARVSEDITGSAARHFTATRAFFPSIVEDQFIANHNDSMGEINVDKKKRGVIKSMEVMNNGQIEFAVIISAKHSENSAVGYEYITTIREKEAQILPASANLLELLES